MSAACIVTLDEHLKTDGFLRTARRFVASLRGHVAAVYRISWSADSRMLVSASKDSTLKVRPPAPGSRNPQQC